MRPVYSHLTAIYKANRRHSSRFCRTFSEAKVIKLNLMDDCAGNLVARTVVQSRATPVKIFDDRPAQHPALSVRASGCAAPGERRRGLRRPRCRHYLARRRQPDLDLDGRPGRGACRRRWPTVHLHPRRYPWQVNPADGCRADHQRSRLDAGSHGCHSLRHRLHDCRLLPGRCCCRVRHNRRRCRHCLRNRRWNRHRNRLARHAVRPGRRAWASSGRTGHAN